MNKQTIEFLEQLLQSVSHHPYIRPDELPDIDLYMDQVTTFMDNRFGSSRRHEDDKILTKTMINNYAKNDLLPPPVKKKYSKEHMLLLTFIYYLKNLLSIGDIQHLLTPLTDLYFSKDGERTGSLSLETVYNELLQRIKAQTPEMEQHVRSQLEVAKESFQNAPEDEQDFLQRLCYVCLLSYDVYVKKMVIERLIDQIADDKQKTEEN